MGLGDEKKDGKTFGGAETNPGRMFDVFVAESGKDEKQVKGPPAACLFVAPLVDGTKAGALVDTFEPFGKLLKVRFHKRPTRCAQDVH